MSRFISQKNIFLYFIIRRENVKYALLLAMDADEIRFSDNYWTSCLRETTANMIIRFDGIYIGLLIVSVAFDVHKDRNSTSSG